MIEYQIPLDSLLLPNCKSFTQEIFRILTQRLIYHQRTTLNCLNELIDGLSNPRRLPMQQFIEDKSNCPDIRLTRIRLSLQ